MSSLRIAALSFLSGIALVCVAHVFWFQGTSYAQVGADQLLAGTPSTNPNVSGLRAHTPSNEDVLMALHKKEEELHQRDIQLETLQAQLNEQERSVEQRLNELKVVQKELSTLYEKSKQREDEVFKKLTGSLQRMAPKKASAMISLMEDRLAVDVLLAMKEATVANILNTMEPDRAVVLSSKIAQRKPATHFQEGRARP